MHSSSVWLEYFYVFKLLWRSGQSVVDAISRQKTEHGYTRERGA